MGFRFLKNEDGYVFVLMMLFMPVFFGISLLVIDVARGNNAHSDLQAAADALAIAGARELDGGLDSITRANIAMRTIANDTVSNAVRFASSGEAFEGEGLQYVVGGGDDNDFTVIFLRTIPDSDDDPIDQAFLDANGTSDGTLAEFVYVRATAPQTLQSIFLNPVSLLQEEVPVAAEAVATASTTICEMPPIYMCNPFETDLIPSGTTHGAHNRRQLLQRYESGGLHARLISLHPRGNQTERPGNFGFLQVPDANGGFSSSANTIRSYFAGDRAPVCFQADGVQTKPGAAVSIRQGVNTRMDIYTGSYGQKQDKIDYPSAVNARKGYATPSKGKGANGKDICDAIYSTETASEDGTEVRKAFGLEPNIPMLRPDEFDPSIATSADGAFVGVGTWPLDEYWEVNFGDLPLGNSDALKNTLINSRSGGGDTGRFFNTANEYIEENTTQDGTSTLDVAFLNQPSRYDVYRFEMTEEARTSVLDASGNAAASQPLYTHFSRYGDDDEVGESGLPSCSLDALNPQDVPEPPTVSRDFEGRDRRVVPIAIIDCNAPENDGSGQTLLKVNRFAKAFLVRPMEKNGNLQGSDQQEENGTANRDGSLDVEIIGLEGSGIGAPVDDIAIREAYLVR